MKKTTIFSIVLAAGFAAVFAACLKDAENQNLPAVVKEPVTSSDEGAEDRGVCSKKVTISGGFGLVLCGNLNWYIGSICTGCGAGYGSVAIESNTYTTTMLNTCFTLINNTGTTKTVGFTVAGNSGICPITGGYPVPAHGYAMFCIGKSGSCCQVFPADCE